MEVDRAERRRGDDPQLARLRHPVAHLLGRRRPARQALLVIVLAQALVQGLGVLLGQPDHVAHAQLLEHLAEHGVDARARQEARRICKFFAAQARQHHADEETLVFPALVRKGDPELVQHVLRLQQDHGWLEEDWLELSPQLQAVAEGYSWYELDGLRHGVGVFTALYHEHIALEESLIYPEAKRRQQVAQAANSARTVTSGFWSR